MNENIQHLVREIEKTLRNDDGSSEYAHSMLMLANSLRDEAVDLKWDRVESEQVNQKPVDDWGEDDPNEYTGPDTVEERDGEK